LANQSTLWRYKLQVTYHIKLALYVTIKFHLQFKEKILYQTQTCKNIYIITSEHYKMHIFIKPS